MTFLTQLGAAASVAALLVTALVTAVVIYIIARLLGRVWPLKLLKSETLSLSAMVLTALACAAVAWYLTRAYYEANASAASIRIAETTLTEKSEVIALQKKTIDQLTRDLDIARKMADKTSTSQSARSDTLIDIIKAQQEDLAALRKNTTGLEQALLASKRELADAEGRYHDILRFINQNTIAPLVARSARLTAGDVDKLADMSLRVVRPRFRSNRIEATCPFKFLTAGAQFTLKVGKEELKPDVVEFDVAQWRVKLTWYAVDVADGAMRFTHTDECTLAVENPANPCNLSATFKKGATAGGWLEKTEAFRLTKLEIGDARIIEMKDGWKVEEPPARDLKTLVKDVVNKL